MGRKGNEMGTSAMTYIHSGNRDTDVICAIYRQGDGYPTGMGEEIKTALGNKEYVNGLHGDYTSVVNGMGCAAATLIKSLKEEAGNIYMVHPDAGDEQYNYHIFFDGDRYDPAPGAKLSVAVEGRDNKKIWTGLISDFDGEVIEETEHAAA